MLEVTETAMMNLVISKLETTPGRVLYVGDSEVDYKFAQDSVTHLVLVSWGFRDRSELEELGRVCIVDDAQGIIAQCMR